jgi:hypothetical protein
MGNRENTSGNGSWRGRHPSIQAGPVLQMPSTLVNALEREKKNTGWGKVANGNLANSCAWSMR